MRCKAQMEAQAATGKPQVGYLNRREGGNGETGETGAGHPTLNHSLPPT